VTARNRAIRRKGGILREQFAVHSAVYLVVFRDIDVRHGWVCGVDGKTPGTVWTGSVPRPRPKKILAFAGNLLCLRYWFYPVLPVQDPRVLKVSCACAACVSEHDSNCDDFDIFRTDDVLAFLRPEWQRK
jgi:hypothetical protein